MALTDHGNMNGLAYQVLHAKKMQEAGQDFKPIYGCEAYFIPSIEEWREEYEKAMEDKKRARSVKKDEQSGATIEDAGSSKKTQDILRRRQAPCTPGAKPDWPEQSCSSWCQSLISRRTSIAILASTTSC